MEALFLGTLAAVWASAFPRRAIAARRVECLAVLKHGKAQVNVVVPSGTTTEGHEPGEELAGPSDWTPTTLDAEGAAAHFGEATRGYVVHGPGYSDEEEEGADECSLPRRLLRAVEAREAIRAAWRDPEVRARLARDEAGKAHPALDPVRAFWSSPEGMAERGKARVALERAAKRRAKGAKSRSKRDAEFWIETGDDAARFGCPAGGRPWYPVGSQYDEGDRDRKVAELVEYLDELDVARDHERSRLAWEATRGSQGGRKAARRNRRLVERVAGHEALERLERSTRHEAGARTVLRDGKVRLADPEASAYLRAGRLERLARFQCLRHFLRHALLLAWRGPRGRREACKLGFTRWFRAGGLAALFAEATTSRKARGSWSRQAGMTPAERAERGVRTDGRPRLGQCPTLANGPGYLLALEQQQELECLAGWLAEALRFAAELTAREEHDGLLWAVRRGLALAASGRSDGTRRPSTVTAAELQRGLAVGRGIFALAARAEGAWEEAQAQGRPDTSHALVLPTEVPVGSDGESPFQEDNPFV